MSTREPSFDKEASSAQPESRKHVDVTGNYSFIASLPPVEQEQVKLHYASIMRRIAGSVLRAMEVNDTVQERGELVSAELIANAFLYGGKLDRLSLIRRPDIGPMAVQIVVVNPAYEDDTPAVQEIGAHVAEVGNHRAEHGRGLVLVRHFTRGAWGQKNERTTEGKRQLSTFAIVDDAPLEEFPLPEDDNPTPFNHAA